MNYENKWFIITGAYRGIGKSVAEYFGERGANLVLTYHHAKDKTNELGLLLKNKFHIQVIPLFLDLKEEESIKELYKYLRNKKIEIDYLINNAALSMDSDYLLKTKKEFMNVLEVNIVGTFLMMQHFDQLFRNRYIFNISSTDGIDTGNIYSIDYNCSKAGINMLGKTLSVISSNRIITLCPNWVDTESTRMMNKEYLESELKRIGQKKLINPNVIPKVIDECIKKDYPSGSIIRIEGEEDVRRID